MADQNQLEVLEHGVEVWNRWREENPKIDINLVGANLSSINLQKINLNNAKLHDINLCGANLMGASFKQAILNEANLTKVNAIGANFSYAYIRNANISSANLMKCNFQGTELDGTIGIEVNLSGSNLQFTWLTNSCLTRADLKDCNFNDSTCIGISLDGASCISTSFQGADLTRANLEYATLIKVNLEGSTLYNCRIHGISAWGLQGTPKLQSDLIITSSEESQITVDDLQIAQFIYLLLNNKHIRNFIDSVTSKAVLVLGRFTEERKAVLEVLHQELRKRNYLPIIFDFSKPLNRDITETISTLAHLSKFIIADITDAKSIPQELQAIVPDLPSVPVQPILLALQKEYGMFEHFKKYSWVLPTYYYTDIYEVMSSVSDPLEAKLIDLTIS